MQQYGIDFKDMGGNVVKEMIFETLDARTQLLDAWEYGDESPIFPETAVNATPWVREVLTSYDARIIRNVARLVRNRSQRKPFTGHFTHSR